VASGVIFVATPYMPWRSAVSFGLLPNGWPE
jgi:hypothetical protein